MGWIKSFGTERGAGRPSVCPNFFLLLNGVIPYTSKYWQTFLYVCFLVLLGNDNPAREVGLFYDTEADDPVYALLLKFRAPLLFFASVRAV